MLAIRRSGGTNGDRPGTCHNCGSIGHWAYDCPKSKTNQAEREGRGNRTGNGNRGNTGRDNWKTTSPDINNDGCTKMGDFDGTSKWKRDSNGKTLYWCGKCERWSTPHWINEHRGTPSANLATPTVLGDPDSVEDWPCAFLALPNYESPNYDHYDHLPYRPSDADADDLQGFDSADFWSLVLPYLPLSLCFLWCFFESPFAPALWFSTAWLLYHGPESFFTLPLVPT
jgi:hypothetical protein